MKLGVSAIALAQKSNHPSYGIALQSAYMEKTGTFRIGPALATGLGSRNFSFVHLLFRAETDLSKRWSWGAVLGYGIEKMDRYSGDGAVERSGLVLGTSAYWNLSEKWRLPLDLRYLVVGNQSLQIASGLEFSW